MSGSALFVSGVMLEGKVCRQKEETFKSLVNSLSFNASAEVEFVYFALLKQRRIWAANSSRVLRLRYIAAFGKDFLS
jgi:hypothetical protein